MNSRTRSGILSVFFCLTFWAAVSAQQSAVTTGKEPIIIIPGLTGSELNNGKTGEHVWFRKGRAKDDDLRLPISPNIARNRDDLVPGDIIRSVKLLKLLPETEIYERLIDALVKRGYREARWGTATADDAKDTFFVFPYDWRRDNVESARLLVERIETFKRGIRNPDLKFNVIAHSMGGLIARYAAMYGDADLPAGQPRPTWAGARHFGKIFLLGTPNEGSVSAIETLLKGFSYIGGGLNLPFIQNVRRFEVFTIPSMYQVLPHEGSLLAYDENLKPIVIDIYDPATWDKYGWSIWETDDFVKKLSPQEQRNARAYFVAVLARAKAFQTALDANTSPTVPVELYLVGADCKETQNAILLLRDKKGKWETHFKPTEFTAADGRKVTTEQVKTLLNGLGDGVVTKRSLAVETGKAAARRPVLPVAGEIFQCEGHNKLVTNPVIQDKLFTLLNPVVASN